MDMLIVHNVENEERLKLKVVSIKPIEGNPNLTLSITPNNVVYLEDVGSYLNSKFESVGSEYMNKDMELFFNHDMTVKPKFEHFKELDMLKYYFYHELDIDEWTKIILRRIHNGRLWMEDSVVNILVELIHEVIGLSKQVSVPISEKMVKKKVGSYTKVEYNGKVMVINTIKKDNVRFLSKTIS